MKKIFTCVLLFFCCSWLNQIHAQACTTYKGVEAIVLRYGINSFGQQATQEPFLSSDNTFYLTNRYTTWNEATGAFSTSCSHGFGALVPPVLGHETWNYVCACIEKGPVFWSVNYSCDDDNNNCGVSYDFMPVTDPNSSGTNWSSPTTWKNDSYNNLNTALGRFISKPINIDVSVPIHLLNGW
ncbi:hypothetical protein BH11BAC6_BH11BAC6_01040 [soil metagenome]